MTRRLLGVFAHPDDESFGPAGTLALHAAAGVDVHIATMTDGAAGAPAPGFPEGDELARVRRTELRGAAAILGATLHHFSYRDSGFVGNERNHLPDAFINVDVDEPIADLVALIREIRPDVVFTHDENGGYRHPDHIRCHVVVRAAFEAAGEPTRFVELGEPFAPARLYSETMSDRLINLAVRALRLVGRDPTRTGVNNDVDLTGLGTSPRDITTRIDIRDGWAPKRAAGACHVSQRGDVSPLRHVPLWLLRLLWRNESFIREWPPAWPGLREHSLFD